jgi:hypothetical protein
MQIINRQALTIFKIQLLSTLCQTKKKIHKNHAPSIMKEIKTNNQ